MRVRASTLVSRPLEDVFPYVVDLSTTSEWDPNIAESRKLTPGEVVVGSEFELVAELRGRRIPFHYRVTELEGGRRLVAEGRGDKAVSIDDVTFERANGGTRVTWAADIHLTGVRRIVDPLLWPVYRRMGREAMAGLKAKLEAPG
jgi:carbon monoxide dehydrogenase subunit G